MLFSTFPRARSGLKWSTVVIFAQDPPLSSLDRVQRRLRVVVGDKLFCTLQPFSHRRGVESLSLLYRYFNGKCSDEMRSLDPPVLNFTARTRHATHIAENHPQSPHIPLARCKFHSSSFFPRTTALWNRRPRGCFPDHYNLNLFSSRVDRYLSYTHIRINCASYPVILYLEWPSGLVQGELHCKKKKKF